MVLEDVQVLHEFYKSAINDIRWFDAREALRKLGLGEWIIMDGKPEFQLTAEGRRLFSENVSGPM